MKKTMTAALAAMMCVGVVFESEAGIRRGKWKTNRLDDDS
jgi:hypothetical protein